MAMFRNVASVEYGNFGSRAGLLLRAGVFVVFLLCCSGRPSRRLSADRFDAWRHGLRSHHGVQVGKWQAALSCGGDPTRACVQSLPSAGASGLGGEYCKLDGSQPLGYYANVWVPFAKRFMKSQKYQSFVLQDNGTFLAKMIPGPSCFSHWQASFRLLRTALVMTDIISISNLMEWETMVDRLQRQYPGCWGLVAAAERAHVGSH
eukprot:s2661_g8.t1